MLSRVPLMDELNSFLEELVETLNEDNIKTNTFELSEALESTFSLIFIFPVYETVKNLISKVHSQNLVFQKVSWRDYLRSLNNSCRALSIIIDTLGTRNNLNSY
jgi:hypothetical protein